VDRIVFETDRVGDLDRHRPDGDIDAGVVQQRHQGAMKVGHRPRLERQ